MHDAAPVSRGSRSSAWRVSVVAVFLFALFGIEAGHAQTPATAPDTLLVNGKVVVHDGPPAQALAVYNGRIAAIGDSSSIRSRANASTRVIDLGGRTVIPGLIDSHIHAIRAGLSYTTEVHWFGVRTLQEALDRIRAAAKTAPKGSWLVVAGGWTDRQFREGRRPTQAEIAAAAPDHHLYIQLLYTHVLLGPGGADALGMRDKAGNAELSGRLAIERDTNGNPTGWLAGDNRAISDLFNLLPRPTAEQKLAGTRAFFRALNAMGITGVSDPGGYNIEIDDYQPLFQLWREHGLTLRVRYSLSAPRRDQELEDFKALTQMRSMGFGDDLFGQGGDDYVDGENGDDILHGGPGDDELHGRNGSDVMLGNEGNDRLYGERGEDTIDGGPGDDTIQGNLDDDTIQGGEGDDRIQVVGGGFDRVACGPGADTVYADVTDEVASDCEIVRR